MLITFRFGTLVKIFTAMGIAGAVLTLYFAAQPATGETVEPAKPPTSEPVQRRMEATRHHVHGTAGAGLNLRECASVRCARAGAVPEGRPLAIDCWTSGHPGATERRWLRAEYHGTTVYAAARYLKPERTTAVPECNSTLDLARRH